MTVLFRAPPITICPGDYANSAARTAKMLFWRCGLLSGTAGSHGPFGPVIALQESSGRTSWGAYYEEALPASPPLNHEPFKTFDPGTLMSMTRPAA